MFGQKLYDPRADWRREPMTEGQRKALDELGLPVRSGMTKGEASDAISSQTEPDDEELEFVRLFGVKLGSNPSQLDARKAIAAIVTDESQRAKWDARPATTEQRAIIKFVDGKVGGKLTKAAADEIIDAYSEDPEKTAKLEAIEKALSELEDREDSIRCHWEDINDWPEAYGLKRVSLKLVTKAIERWEREAAVTLDMLEARDDFLDQLAHHICSIEPSKMCDAPNSRSGRQSPPAARFHDSSTQRLAKPQSSFGFWGWVAATFLILTFFVLVGGFSK